MDNTKANDLEQVERAFKAGYPSRERYYCCKFLRSFFASGAHAALVKTGADGHRASALIVHIALQEDRFGYKYPPSFWIGDLRKTLGWTKPEHPPAAIRLALESGWLATTWTGEKINTRRETYFYTKISSEIGTCSQETSSGIGTYTGQISSQIGTYISSDRGDISTDLDDISTGIGIPPSLIDPSLIDPSLIDPSLKESALSKEFTLSNQSKTQTPKPEPKTKRKTQDTDPELLAWVELWNRLHAERVVGVSVSPKISQHLRKAWDRVKKSEELQELLKAPREIESMIRNSEFLRGGSANWFDLAKLLSGKNSEGAYIAQKLLDGAYRTINRSNRPGANVASSAVHVPNRTRIEI